MNYREYILSPEWRAKRYRALCYYGKTCHECGQSERFLKSKGSYLQVHHKHYDTLGEETMEDLEVLCRDCHHKADEQRASEMSSRRYGRRLDGWASKVYGEDWDQTQDPSDVERAFDEWLENRNDEEGY